LTKTTRKQQSFDLNFRCSQLQHSIEIVAVRRRRRCWLRSTNLDYRSFRLNDEANLNAIDPEFAGEQAGVFHADKQASHLVSIQDWRQRLWREKAVERLAGLLRSQV